MNLLVAIVFSVIAKILYITVPGFLSGSVGYILWQIIICVIRINLVLMVFNLIPCPPSFTPLCPIRMPGERKEAWSP